jgi:hypothetical protein
MNERDTPETDEAATYYNDLCDTPVSADFASRLERQRDELLEALEDLINSPQPDEREGEFGRGTAPRKRAAAVLASVKGGGK